MAIETDVAQHYGTPGIAARILTALRTAHGAEAQATVDALAPADHFHGRGVAATQELVAILQPQPGERLLDIGSGIGGPARWIAAKFGVHVTGVDLTPEFCAAAEELNRATGLADRVTIKQGSALALPVPDNAFDRAYSQNVIMNIADKPRFYREAFRALRPGGVFAIANACAGPGGAPHYPQMWAATAATSFLATPAETRRVMTQAGFTIVTFRDTTDSRLPTQTRQVERGTGTPLGIHVLMGADVVREAMQNSARNVAEGRTVMIEALLRKPGL
jgi:SAM-dependent methyltransferase